MSWLTKLLLWGILMCFVAAGAHATPICAEKSDAYKLALADMQGTGDTLWNEMVAEGKCGNIPAQYLWTLDTYKAADELSRVVEYLVEGQRAYGLRVDLPRGVWMIHDDGQWEQTDPVVREWFQNLRQPDNPTLSCCGFADAYYADKVVTRGGKNYAVITDDRDDTPLGRPHIPIGTEIEIPNHKYKWDKGNPTGHNVIFVGAQRQVFCFVTGTGI